MSEQIEPGEELVEDTKEAAPEGDPQAQEGEDGNAGETVDQEAEVELAAEDTAREQKLSRFQRFKQEQEERLLEKEREIRYWRDAALKQAPPEQAQQAEQELEPQLSDFDGHGIDVYLKAHQKWAQKQFVAEARRVGQETVEAERVNRDFQAKVEVTRKKYPDFDATMVKAREIQMSGDSSEFILGSEIPGELGYYLAKNPAEARRLNSLTPIRRLAELGKLEDRLSAGTVVAPTATKAPAKLTAVKGSAVITSDPAEAARHGREAWKAANAQRVAAKSAKR